LIRFPTDVCHAPTVSNCRRISTATQSPIRATTATSAAPLDRRLQSLTDSGGNAASADAARPYRPRAALGERRALRGGRPSVTAAGGRRSDRCGRTEAAGAGQFREAPTGWRGGFSCAYASVKWLSERRSLTSVALQTWPH